METSERQGEKRMRDRIRSATNTLRATDWLGYPSNTKINKVGLPVGIPEAQASGIGVCWQELPGRREQQLEFLGGGGVLFRDIGEVPEIVASVCPEELRLRGIENARKCDIEQHKGLLSSAWDSAKARRAAMLVDRGAASGFDCRAASGRRPNLA